MRPHLATGSVNGAVDTAVDTAVDRTDSCALAEVMPGPARGGLELPG